MIWALLISSVLAPVTGWTSYRSQPDAIIEGSFISCPDNEDGSYGERVFLWKQGKVSAAEVHMGPRDEFAVFLGEVDGDREHAGPENLLGPAFHFSDVDSRTGRNWTIASLNWHVNIRRGDGSYPECYTFWIKISPIGRRSLAQ